MEDNLKHLLRKSGGAFAPPEVKLQEVRLRGDLREAD